MGWLARTRGRTHWRTSREKVCRVRKTMVATTIRNIGRERSRREYRRGWALTRIWRLQTARFRSIAKIAFGPVQRRVVVAAAAKVRLLHAHLRLHTSITRRIRLTDRVVFLPFRSTVLKPYFHLETIKLNNFWWKRSGIYLTKTITKYHTKLFIAHVGDDPPSSLSPLFRDHFGWGPL